MHWLDAPTERVKAVLFFESFIENIVGFLDQTDVRVLRSALEWQDSPLLDDYWQEFSWSSSEEKFMENFFTAKTLNIENLVEPQNEKIECQLPKPFALKPKRFSMNFFQQTATEKLRNPKNKDQLAPIKASQRKLRTASGKEVDISSTQGTCVLSTKNDPHISSTPQAQHFVLKKGVRLRSSKNTITEHKPPSAKLNTFLNAKKDHENTLKAYFAKELELEREYEPKEQNSMPENISSTLALELFLDFISSKFFLRDLFKTKDPDRLLELINNLYEKITVSCEFFWEVKQRRASFLKIHKICRELLEKSKENKQTLQFLQSLPLNFQVFSQENMSRLEELRQICLEKGENKLRNVSN